MCFFYTSVLFLGVQNSSSIQPIVSMGRPVFRRERDAGMYSCVVYAASQVAYSQFSFKFLFLNFKRLKWHLMLSFLVCLSGADWGYLCPGPDCTIWSHYLFYVGLSEGSRYVRTCFNYCRLGMTENSWLNLCIVGSCAGTIFIYIMFLLLTTYFTFYGMMVVGIARNRHVAAIISSLVYSLGSLTWRFIVPTPVSVVN